MKWKATAGDKEIWSKQQQNKLKIFVDYLIETPDCFVGNAKPWKPNFLEFFSMVS